MNIIKKIKNLDWEEILPLMKQAHKTSKKSYFWLAKDMYNAMKEGYSYYEYFIYDFVNHTDKKYRESFIATYRHYPLISKHFNHDPAKYDYFGDKGQFNRNFKDIKGIEALDLRVDSFEDFKKFIDSHDFWFAKTPGDCGGHGVKRQDKHNLTDSTVDRLYEDYRNTNYVVVEEAIKQHPEVSKLSLNSVNTLRIITTIDDDGRVSIPFVVSRISVSDSYKDNACEGGAWCIVSKNGTIDYDYFSHLPIIKTYSCNPYTGFKFKGFKFPFFEESKKVCEKAALRCENHYVGWDVAITENGPCIIEANDSTSPFLMQAPNQLDDGYGRLHELESALGISLHD